MYFTFVFDFLRRFGAVGLARTHPGKRLEQSTGPFAVDQIIVILYLGEPDRASKYQLSTKYPIEGLQIRTKNLRKYSKTSLLTEYKQN